MKKTIFLVNAILFMAVAFVWQSCRYDACKARAVECLHEGVCDDGTCVCKLGWEGDSCQNPLNEKFASHYTTVRSELFNENPPRRVDNDDTLYMYANQEKRNIVYFYSIRDSIVEFEGNVRENALTIPEQVVQGHKYRGEGSLNGTVLTIQMTKENITNATSSKITWVGRQYESF